MHQPADYALSEAEDGSNNEQGSAGEEEHGGSEREGSFSDGEDVMDVPVRRTVIENDDDSHCSSSAKSDSDDSDYVAPESDTEDEDDDSGSNCSSSSSSSSSRNSRRAKQKAAAKRRAKAKARLKAKPTTTRVKRRKTRHDVEFSEKEEARPAKRRKRQLPLKDSEYSAAAILRALDDPDVIDDVDFVLADAFISNVAALRTLAEKRLVLFSLCASHHAHRIIINILNKLDKRYSLRAVYDAWRAILRKLGEKETGMALNAPRIKAMAEDEINRFSVFSSYHPKLQATWVLYEASGKFVSKEQEAFAKTALDDWRVFAAIQLLVSLGEPILDVMSAFHYSSNQGAFDMGVFFVIEDFINSQLDLETDLPTELTAQLRKVCPGTIMRREAELSWLSYATNPYFVSLLAKHPVDASKFTRAVDVVARQIARLNEADEVIGMRLDVFAKTALEEIEELHRRTFSEEDLDSMRRVAADKVFEEPFLEDFPCLCALTAHIFHRPASTFVLERHFGHMFLVLTKLKDAVQDTEETLLTSLEDVSTATFYRAMQKADGELIPENRLERDLIDQVKLIDACELMKMRPLHPCVINLASLAYHSVLASACSFSHTLMYSTSCWPEAEAPPPPPPYTASRSAWLTALTNAAVASPVTHAGKSSSMIWRNLVLPTCWHCAVAVSTTIKSRDEMSSCSPPPPLPLVQNAHIARQASSPSVTWAGRASATSSDRLLRLTIVS